MIPGDASAIIAVAQKAAFENFPSYGVTLKNANIPQCDIPLKSLSPHTQGAVKVGCVLTEIKHCTYNSRAFVPLVPPTQRVQKEVP